MIPPGGVLPLLCPSCRGEMRILAFLTDPPIVSRILLHLDLHHLPPPLYFVFDQSLPAEFDD